MSDQPQLADRYFTMSGRSVFRRAVEHMAESTRLVLRRAGLTINDIDRLVAHQANLRILRSLADVLGLPPDRVLTNIEDVGNTAGASIPIALDHGYAKGVLRPGDRVLLTAFGGGLTWASALLTWPDLAHSSRAAALSDLERF